MDVRSIVDVEPEVEHNGTVPVWYLVHPREMKALTAGVAVPGTANVTQLVNALVASGGGDLDYAAIATVIFKLAGVN